MKVIITFETEEELTEEEQLEIFDVINQFGDAIELTTEE